MGRGIMIVKECGARAFHASQGGCYVVRMDDGWIRSLGRRLTRLAKEVNPGVYRFRTGYDAGWGLTVTLGKRLGDVTADVLRSEGERLIAAAKAQNTYASTGKPGVAFRGRQGYQHMADMARSRLCSLQSESRRLGERLVEAASWLS